MPTPIGHALGGVIVALLAPGARSAPGTRSAPGASGASGASGAMGAVRCTGGTGAGASGAGATGAGATEADAPAHRTAPPHQPHLRAAPHPSHPSHPTHPTHLAYCALAACLPDVDFFWGRHNMETHSLGFAALVALAVFIWRRDRRLALACFLAVCTHVLFDWLGSDDFPPLGVMALWPLTTQFYFANAFIFDAISRRYWLPGFVQHNVIAVLRELAILAPAAAASWWWWRAKRTGHGATETQRRDSVGKNHDSTARDVDS